MATSPRSARAPREKRLGRSPKTSGKGNGNGAKNHTVPAPVASPAATEKTDAKILFQKILHTAGPRTYASHLKELANGNHLLVLTEAKRDPETGEAHKTRLLVYGEDFSAFFKLLHETAGFIRANPLSEEIRQKRNKFWAKKSRESRAAGRSAGQ